MAWRNQLKNNSLEWLLEESDAGVRYLAMRDLLDFPSDDAELLAARSLAYQKGPIAKVLSAMHPHGFWEQAGPGYNPKYRSTVWAIILLAQLGARVEEDPRIAKACEYLLEHALTPTGQFSTSGSPSGTIDCLQGNLCWALSELGAEPTRLDAAYEWMARTITGEGLSSNEDKNAPVRYYAYKCGPGFACGANYTQPCAWGATKVMLAFGSLPVERRTPLIRRAIQQGIEFLFSVDPATAAYPSGENARPSGSWFKFGFPVFYVTDVLQICECMAKLGYASDPRLANALAMIRERQDENGRWALEYDYAGKTWGDYGTKKSPNKWVTLRALRVLKAASTDSDR